MAEDFDINALAEYLHLSPAQVTKMAERGTLPGRKIAGQWRFAPAEVHHWLEQRIGVSDQAELIQVEDVLRQAPGAATSISIAQLLPVEAIQIPLEARTRHSAITAMCELAARTGMLWDPEKMAEAVQAREELHPTALDNGVALLHPRRPQSNILSESVLALGRTYQGIPFGGRTLTDIFFLICSTNDREHLQILARLSRLISDPSLLDAIRSTEDPREVQQRIAEQEEQLGR